MRKVFHTCVRSTIHASDSIFGHSRPLLHAPQPPPPVSTLLLTLDCTSPHMHCTMCVRSYIYNIIFWYVSLYIHIFADVSVLVELSQIFHRPYEWRCFICALVLPGYTISDIKADMKIYYNRTHIYLLYTLYIYVSAYICVIVTFI